MAGVKLRYAASGSTADVCRRVPRWPSFSILLTLQHLRHSSRRPYQAEPAIAGPRWTHHSHPQTQAHSHIFTHPQAQTPSRTKSSRSRQTRPHTCSGVSPVSPVPVPILALGATIPTAPPPRPAAHFIYADCLSDNSRRLNFASVSVAGSSPPVRRVLHPLFDQRRNFSSTTATMVATKIDGTAIAKSIRERLCAEVAAKQKLNPRYQPCLKIIQGVSWSLVLLSASSIAQY